eukprot:3563579-Pyramimonas_sp.AAC.1
MQDYKGAMPTQPRAAWAQSEHNPSTPAPLSAPLINLARGCPRALEHASHPQWANAALGSTSVFRLRATS